MVLFNIIRDQFRQAPTTYGTIEDVNQQDIANAYDNGDNNWEEALRVAIIQTLNANKIKASWKTIASSIIDQSWIVILALNAAITAIQKLIGILDMDAYFISSMIGWIVLITTAATMVKSSYNFFTKKKPHFTYTPMPWETFNRIFENAISIQQVTYTNIESFRKSLSTPVYNFITRSITMSDVVEICDDINRNLRMGFATISSMIANLTRRIQSVETRLENVETGLENVETRLENVETGLENVQTGLANVQNDVIYNRALLNRIAEHLGVSVDGIATSQ